MTISEESEGNKRHLAHLPERLEGLLGRLQKSRPNDYSYTANDKRSAQTRYGKCQRGSEPEKPQSDCSRAHRSLGTFRLLTFLNPLRFLLNDRQQPAFLTSSWKAASCSRLRPVPRMILSISSSRFRRSEFIIVDTNTSSNGSNRLSSSTSQTDLLTEISQHRRHWRAPNIFGPPHLGHR